MGNLLFVFQQLAHKGGKPFNPLKHLKHLPIISLYLHPKILCLGYKVFKRNLPVLVRIDAIVAPV